MASTSSHRSARSAIALALLAAAAPTVPAAASATTPTDAVCTNALTLQFTPGFGPRPGSGSSTSHGETGTQLCTGTIGGYRITGPGTVGVDETYSTGPACLTDSSDGVVSLTLPTTGGPVHLVGALAGRRLGLVETVDIAFPSARFHGVGPVLPIDGSCLLTPLTQALVSITGTLKG